VATHQSHEPVILTIQELRDLSKDVVRETLTAVGVDMTDLTEVQKDFAYLRTWRKTTESLHGKTLCAVLGMIIAGAMATLWLGIRSILSQGGS
jgi:hypothetical protein